MFIVGAALFGVGSLLAALSRTSPASIVGEAIIEGIGASLMMPATLGDPVDHVPRAASGRPRSRAGARPSGAGVALGPLVGGFLTTNYSWRWSFRINVIVVPLAILGRAALHAPQTAPAARRERIDVPGALLVAVGMFLLVFALSEGARYGWWRPLERSRSPGPRSGRPTAAVSIVPLVLRAGGRAARARSTRRAAQGARAIADPLFEFGQLRHPRLPVRADHDQRVLAMGQLGFLFVLPVFLQDGKHLVARSTTGSGCSRRACASSSARRSAAASPGASSVTTVVRSVSCSRRRAA